MLMGLEECRRHIEHKMRAGELSAVVGGRMIEMLDRGVEPDFEALKQAASYPPPGRYTYHTAPTSARDPIERFGLRSACPSDGPWGDNAVGQPRGIYVTAEPDTAGVWAFHYDEWDVWQIDMTGLPWWPDMLNAGCYRLTAAWPDRLVLLGTYSAAAVLDA